jgi:type IV pilus assembly protein PilV
MLIHNRGSSLIEVLIALLVLAIGLLGVLSLQANGLNSNQRAIFVSEAHYLANDMADRIMAFGNTPAGAIGGEFDDTDTDNAYPSVDCSGGCSSVDDIINHDQSQWKTLVDDSSLPGARGQVFWEPPVYTIRVMWDQDRTGASGIDCASNNKEVNLTCFQMQIQLL